MALRLLPFVTKLVVVLLCLHPVIVQNFRVRWTGQRPTAMPKLADMEDRRAKCEEQLTPRWEETASEDGHLWKELEKILNKQDEIDASEVAPLVDECDHPGLLCPPGLRCALCIVYHQMRKHYMERKSGQVVELLQIIPLQTKPISETVDGKPHRDKMTCQEAKTMTWVVTKWKIDAAIELGMGMSDIEQMTSLARLLQCDSKEALPDPTCSVLEELRKKCPEEFANAAQEHEEIFTCYALGLVSAREVDVAGTDDKGYFEEPKGVDRPDTQVPQVGDVIVDDIKLGVEAEEADVVAKGHPVLNREDLEGLAWLESVEPTPANSVEELEEQLGMVLLRIQSDNGDLATIECAKRALRLRASERMEQFRANPNCMNVLIDAIRLDANRFQRERKCCCTPGREICKWKVPEELERSWSPLQFLKKQCPGSFVEDQTGVKCQELGNQSSDQLMSLAELSNRAEAEEALGHAQRALLPYSSIDNLPSWAHRDFDTVPSWAMAQNEVKGWPNNTTEPSSWVDDVERKLGYLGEEVSSARERHVDASPLARDAVEWYEACKMDERVHRVHKGHRGTSEKCPAPFATEDIKACPSSMEMYCYDMNSTQRKPQDRCCCGVNTGGIEENGTYSVKKTAKAQCAADLAREIQFREQKKQTEAATQAVAARADRHSNPFAATSEPHGHASPLAEDTAEWYEACEANARIHRVHKGRNESTKCPAPPTMGVTKTCPSNMETYCYDANAAGKLPQDRCCCGVGRGRIKKKTFRHGHLFTKKIATQHCATDLDLEIQHREKRNHGEKNTMPGTGLVNRGPDKFAYYEACKQEQLLGLTEGCGTAHTTGTCPVMMDQGRLRNLDFTMFCYAHNKQQRCCCREHDVRIASGSKFGGPTCAHDWPTYMPSQVRRIETEEVQKGVFHAIFRGEEPPHGDALRAQFNTIFDDPALRTWMEKQSGEKTKWGPEPKKAAKALMKQIEEKLESLNTDRTSRRWWRCTEAAPRICTLTQGAKGYLKKYTARISHLTEKIARLIIHEDKIGIGNPNAFTELTACISVVIQKYRDAQNPELQALDTHARAVAADFANLEIEGHRGVWHATKKGFGFLFRGISAIVGSLLYAVMTPVVMFNEGIQSVRNSGELWRFPIGFLLRGPVISIFGKVHSKWWSLDYQDAEDDGFFRWGIAGAAGRSWRLFKKATTEELCTDLTKQMFLMVDLHRQLNLAYQCGETVNFAK